MRLRLQIGIAAAALFGAAAVSGPAAAGPWGPGYFPNVPLTNQDGKVVRFYDDLLKGKTVAVNLIYTHCTASCPLETAKMRQLQKLLGDHVGKDIFFYSISIDPAHDTPEVLKAYAERYHVGPGWQFLTGKEEDIKIIARKLGLSSLTDLANRDGHQPSLMVGDEAKGQWMRNSAVDNPRFLAISMSNFFGWKTAALAKSYSEIHDLPQVDRGTYLFKSRCAACHTVGKGDGVGPDLANVVGRRDHCWVTRYITEPDRMLTEKDPIAVELFNRYRNVRMPNLALDAEDVAALVGYIQKESRALTQPAQTASAARQGSP